MVLKVIALLFFSAALLLALIFGHDWPLGAMLFSVNAAALNMLQAGVQRHVSAGLWDSLFVPLLSVPAWTAPAAIGAVLVLIAALRPGRD
jgi:hypothetical protein